MNYYRLDQDENPVVETNTTAWEGWMRTRERTAHDTVGLFVVSTVFLGMDHNHGNGPPVLWETMVFPLDPRTGEHDWSELECRRYTTAQAAREGHAEILKRYDRERLATLANQ